MKIEELTAACQVAEAAGDVDGCAACVMAAQQLAAARPELREQPAMRYFADARLLHLFAAAFLALERGDDALARIYYQAIPQAEIFLEKWLPEGRYYIGLLFYRAGDYPIAQQFFSQQVEKYPQDAESWFAKGNCEAHLGQLLPAAVSYRKALQRRAAFPEAKANLQTVWQASRVAEQEALPLQESVRQVLPDADDWESVRRIPIFINCRDRVEVLRRLVGWLLQAGYERIILLDNASTYPPLLQYYQEIRSARVQVVYLGRNYGHTALWSADILELLPVQGPYVYTDPDVLPTEACPPRFLQAFVRTLAAHPLLAKVGAGLVYDDISCFNDWAFRQHEARYYRAKIAPDTFYANVDTTFALYRGTRYYHRAPSARMTGPYWLRHMPWYCPEGAPLPPDEQYYMEHAGHSSSMKAMKDKADQGK